MGSYVSNTEEQQREMLKEIGYRDFAALFEHIPEEVMMKEALKIPKGCSELEVRAKMEALAGENYVFPHIFRGAGAYRHYIPSIVKSVTAKEDFVTAYTPYQAEISQGNLQAIFEFQTMICELTGMDAANASVYDGASAAAESVFMCRDRKRTDVLVAQTVDPQVMETIKTYCRGRDVQLHMVPQKDGAVDRDALKELLCEKTACFYLQQPNYFGILEDAEELGKLVHEKGCKYIMGCNPIALGIMKTPLECGADIAVGEGQPLGMSLGFGGPYLGFMAATKEMMRKLPGRIVGETADAEGKRGYVLTLQAREQHIRREKAGSNICSNQALCALTACVYLAAMGPEGLKETANLCTSKAHYLQAELSKAGLKPVYQKPYFHEFVTECPVDTGILMKKLQEKGILGGLPLKDGNLLWCVTEMNSKAEMDLLVDTVKEVSADAANI